jgi:hypothetical protein
MGFLADGYERAYAAVEPYVRRLVEREFAERLRNAAPDEELRLRGEMAGLIVERIERLAPRNALY